MIEVRVLMKLFCFIRIIKKSDTQLKLLLAFQSVLLRIHHWLILMCSIASTHEKKRRLQSKNSNVEKKYLSILHAKSNAEAKLSFICDLEM